MQGVVVQGVVVQGVVVQGVVGRRADGGAQLKFSIAKKNWESYKTEFCTPQTTDG